MATTTADAKVPVKKRRMSVQDLARMKSMEYREIAKQMEKKAPEWAKKYVPYIEASLPLIASIMAVADVCMPHIIKYSKMVYNVMKTHEELFYGSLGFFLCFFGGVFPALILAVETYYQCGWERTKRALMDIYEEGYKLKKKYDDENMRLRNIDEDGDGVADKPHAVVPFSERATLFFEVVDPRKVQDSVTIIWGNWLCVVAALNIHFAKVVSLGNGIGEGIQKVLTEFIVPVLKVALPKKYHRWIPVLVGYVSRAIGISIAWTAQSVISATHSSIRGGIMMVRMAFQYMAKQKGKEYHEEDSNTDEICGVVFAGIGMVFQIYSGFAVPFPLWLVTWPFSLLEWYIRVTLADSSMF
mmetsp:Transcript_18150/g.25186  ORF Transcript_18150/g.25186 Transcript_18150/m.25186 type:complete len:356 (-) Transcript_18150:16-1083(-)|eukprot:jgi/Bigna1/86478/estExt_fgenesh1_pg.C_100338